MTAPAQAAAPAVHVEIAGLRLRSPNWREHHFARARRTRHERANVAAALAKFTPPPLPCLVTLTRIGPRLLDGDNLQAAGKGVRDQVARWLGCDDNPAAPVTWRYAQERTNKRHDVPVRAGRFVLRRTESVPYYAVRVLIEHCQVTP